MKEQHVIIGKILAKYPAISQEDQDILNKWLEENEDRKQLFEALTNENDRSQLLDRYIQMKKEEGREWEQLMGLLSEVPKQQRIGWWKSWRSYAVAAVIILFSIGAYVWLNTKQPTQVTSTEKQTKSIDIKPGSDGAILTLADGKKIHLDNLANGNLARQESTDIIKQGSALQYSKGGVTNGIEVVYNTLSTPSGRQFQLVLPDNSKIYLNSSSSITFPIAFTGKDRRVQIQGEVYIEVTKNASQPFIAEAKGMQIEVLGTHFNINAYDDESAIKTTLLEGKVKVKSAENAQVIVLVPGMQAQLQKQTGDMKTVSDVDVEQVIAWKNGLFQFKSTDLRSIMRQISRWYSVDIVYKGNIPNTTFSGKIWRTSNLSKVLIMLESKDLHFKIEGNKVIVFQS